MRGFLFFVTLICRKKRLKKITLYFILLVLFLNPVLYAQNISSFKQNKKWGFKKGESIVIEPQYDTTFGFDQNSEIALVGNINPNKKTINPLTKEIKFEWNYFYITHKNEKIYIKKSETDSTSDITVIKQTQQLYTHDKNAFAATVNGKKYLISKKGKTILTLAFDNIGFTKVPGFYTVENKDPKTGQILIGLVNDKGEFIIQQQYSKISINSLDSVIFCCTAGIKFNGSDDAYNYRGTKLHTSAKHIHAMGRNFAIYRLFESENSYVVHDLNSGKEKTLKVEWLYYLKNDRLLILDGEWFFYDLKTDKRFPVDGRLIKYYKLDG